MEGCGNYGFTIFDTTDQVLMHSCFVPRLRFNFPFSFVPLRFISIFSGYASFISKLFPKVAMIPMMKCISVSLLEDGEHAQTPMLLCG